MALRFLRRYWDLLCRMFFDAEMKVYPPPRRAARPTDSELLRNLRSRENMTRAMKCMTAMSSSRLTIRSFSSGTTVDTIPLTASYNLRCKKCPRLHRNSTLKREKKIRQLRKALTQLLQEQENERLEKLRALNFSENIPQPDPDF